MFKKAIIVFQLFIILSTLSCKADANLLAIKSIDSVINLTLQKTDVNIASGKEAGLKILASSKAIKYERGEAIAYLILGKYHHLISETIFSFDYLLLAKNIIERINDSYLLCDVYRELGEHYRATGEFAKAIEYINVSINLSRQLNATYRLAYAYNRLGAIYYEQNQKDKCENVLEKSILICENHGYNFILADNLNILGALCIAKNNNYTAIQYLEKSLNLAKSCGFESEIPNIQMHLASAFYNIKDYEKGMEASVNGYNYAVKLKMKLFIYYCAHKASKNFRMLNRLDSAYHYLELAYQNRYKIQSSNGQATQAHYEREKQEAVNRMENSKSIFQISILAGLLAVSIIFIIYMRRKHKLVNEKNKLITIQNTELEKANATKDKFFSIIAHDLRNPLGAIKVSIETMADNYDLFEDEDRSELLAEMKKSSGHIYELLENLLTWSQSQRGQMDFNPERINIQLILNAVISLITKQANNKNISLECICDTPVFVFGDSNMLSVILRNLASNAIKFTKYGGKVKIIVNELTENSKEYALISVEDNGIGISKEDIKKLFRIDVSHTTIGSENEPGTGLGLILCNEFVETHGGRIWVESQIGVGSKFKFTIPISDKQQ